MEDLVKSLATKSDDVEARTTKLEVERGMGSGRHRDMEDGSAAAGPSDHTGQEGNGNDGQDEQDMVEENNAENDDDGGAEDVPEDMEDDEEPVQSLPQSTSPAAVRQPTLSSRLTAPSAALQPIEDADNEMNVEQELSTEDVKIEVVKEEREEEVPAAVSAVGSANGVPTDTSSGYTPAVDRLVAESPTSPTSTLWKAKYLAVHGDLPHGEIIAKLPITYHPHFRFYRCNICKYPVRDIANHFRSIQSHSTVYETTFHLFPLILTEFPEHDPHALIPTTITARDPFPTNIPYISNASGYSCNQCNYVCISYRAIVQHLKVEHLVADAPNDALPFEAAPHLQSFFVGGDTKWFPSSAPLSARSASRAEASESPEPESQPTEEAQTQVAVQEELPPIAPLQSLEEIEEQSRELRQFSQSQSLTPGPSSSAIPESVKAANAKLRSLNEQLLAHNQKLRADQVKKDEDARLADEAKDERLRIVMEKLAKHEAEAEAKAAAEEGLRMEALVAAELKAEEEALKATKRDRPEEVDDDDRMDVWMGVKPKKRKLKKEGESEEDGKMEDGNEEKKDELDEDDKNEDDDEVKDEEMDEVDKAVSQISIVPRPIIFVTKNEKLIGADLIWINSCS